MIVSRHILAGPCPCWLAMSYINFTGQHGFLTRVVLTLLVTSVASKSSCDVPGAISTPFNVFPLSGCVCHDAFFSSSPTTWPRDFDRYGEDICARPAYGLNDAPLACCASCITTFKIPFISADSILNLPARAGHTSCIDLANGPVQTKSIVPLTAGTPSCTLAPSDAVRIPGYDVSCAFLAHTLCVALSSMSIAACAAPVHTLHPCVLCAYASARRSCALTCPLVPSDAGFPFACDVLRTDSSTALSSSTLSAISSTTSVASYERCVHHLHSRAPCATGSARVLHAQFYHGLASLYNLLAIPVCLYLLDKIVAAYCQHVRRRGRPTRRHDPPLSPPYIREASQTLVSSYGHRFVAFRITTSRCLSFFSGAHFSGPIHLVPAKLSFNLRNLPQSHSLVQLAIVACTQSTVVIYRMALILAHVISGGLALLHGHLLWVAAAAIPHKFRRSGCVYACRASSRRAVFTGRVLALHMPKVLLLFVCLIQTTTAADSDNTIRLPKFDGQRLSYRAWLLAFTAWVSLKYPDLVGILDNTRPAPDPADADARALYDRHNRQLYGAVCQCVPDWLLQTLHISAPHNGAAAMTHLDVEYGARTPLDRAAAMAAIHKCHMNPRAAIDINHLRYQYDKMREANGDLVSAGGTALTDAALITLLDAAVAQCSAYDNIRMLVTRAGHTTFVAHFTDYMHSVRAEMQMHQLATQHGSSAAAYSALPPPATLQTDCDDLPPGHSNTSTENKTRSAFPPPLPAPIAAHMMPWIVRMVVLVIALELLSSASDAAKRSVRVTISSRLSLDLT